MGRMPVLGQRQLKLHQREREAALRRLKPVGVGRLRGLVAAISIAGQTRPQIVIYPLSHKLGSLGTGVVESHGYSQ